MTFQADPSGSRNSALKGAVVVAIVLVAWWALRGGYDQIPVVETNSTVSTTTTTTIVDG